MINTHFSYKVPVFHGRTLPEQGSVVGYGAIIESLQLAVPMPDKLVVISEKNKRYEIDNWIILTPKYFPEENLYKQLVFALKYEGVNLLFFKKLFEKLGKNEITKLVQIEATGQYSRKIWFLYEWILSEKLEIPNLKIKKSIPLIDEKIQYAVKGNTSGRHRIINNLPGTRAFCPLIRKTKTLENYIAKKLSSEKDDLIKGLHKGLLQRASAFLLLKDSKASFTIEGESPKSKRATRWGQALGQAGIKELNKNELERLQQIVIENSRFIEMGFRKKGGFIGNHDRESGEPIPDHLSAKWQDIESLIDGLIETNKILQAEDFDAVLAATLIAFGFVHIHPFVDGNGRIHRYLVHHVLTKKKFSGSGIIFPISSSILNHIGIYRGILESYSIPLLDFIEWKKTSDNNVEILNNSIDYYRYYDATKEAEFLYFCVEDTIRNIIPKEINYLSAYDMFKNYIDDHYDMPDLTLALLVRFLEQNKGKLSKRARNKEFKALTDEEVENIELEFTDLFEDQ